MDTLANILKDENCPRFAMYQALQYISFDRNVFIPIVETLLAEISQNQQKQAKHWNHFDWSQNVSKKHRDEKYIDCLYSVLWLVYQKAKFPGKVYSSKLLNLSMELARVVYNPKMISVVESLPSEFLFALRNGIKFSLEQWCNSNVDRKDVIETYNGLITLVPIMAINEDVLLLVHRMLLKLVQYMSNVPKFREFLPDFLNVPLVPIRNVHLPMMQQVRCGVATNDILATLKELRFSMISIWKLISCCVKFVDFSEMGAKLQDIPRCIGYLKMYLDQDTTIRQLKICTTSQPTLPPRSFHENEIGNIENLINDSVMGLVEFLQNDKVLDTVKWNAIESIFCVPQVMDEKELLSPDALNDVTIRRIGSLCMVSGMLAKWDHSLASIESRNLGFKYMQWVIKTASLVRLEDEVKPMKKSYQVVWLRVWLDSILGKVIRYVHSVAQNGFAIIQCIILKGVVASGNTDVIANNMYRTMFVQLIQHCDDATQHHMVENVVDLGSALVVKASKENASLLFQIVNGSLTSNEINSVKHMCTLINDCIPVLNQPTKMWVFDYSASAILHICKEGPNFTMDTDLAYRLLLSDKLHTSQFVDLPAKVMSTFTFDFDFFANAASTACTGLCCNVAEKEKLEVVLLCCLSYMKGVVAHRCRDAEIPVLKIIECVRAVFGLLQLRPSLLIQKIVLYGLEIVENCAPLLHSKFHEFALLLHALVACSKLLNGLDKDLKSFIGMCKFRIAKICPLLYTYRLPIDAEETIIDLHFGILLQLYHKFEILPNVWLLAYSLHACIVDIMRYYPKVTSAKVCSIIPKEHIEELVRLLKTLSTASSTEFAPAFAPIANMRITRQISTNSANDKNALEVLRASHAILSTLRAQCENGHSPTHKFAETMNHVYASLCSLQA